MSNIHVKVIIGSTRENRFSDKPAAWILEKLERMEGVDAEILDLRDYPMPYFEEAETPSYKSKPYANPVVARWTEKIAEGDAFVIVAPEYNHGYTAVLKNAIDYVYQEWNNKTVGFVSYGSVMGGRVVEQLREVAVELQMAPVRNAVHMPFEVIVAAGQGKAPSEIFAPYENHGQGLIDQLLWWARALKVARAGA